MNISVEEQKIYDDAGLEKKIVNGREVLIQPNIDYNTPLGIPGNESETNLQRMENGCPPLDDNGKQYELHHLGQKNDGPLAELTRCEHRSNGNYNILHTKSKELSSDIDRKEFDGQRSEHWKERAAEIIYQNN